MRPPKYQAPVNNAEDVEKIVRHTISFEKKRFDENNKRVATADKLIGSYLALMKLRGEWSALDDALKVAKKSDKSGAPANAAYAKLLGTLHENAGSRERVEIALKNKFLSADGHAALLVQRASLNWQEGKGDLAEKDFKQALKIFERPVVQGAYARFLYERGKGAEAKALFEKALAFPQKKTGLAYAWLLLQRGILELEEDKLKEADAYFAKAGAALPKWYLIEEHRAEVLALSKKYDEAKEAYKDLVLRTGNPEFIDALADVYENLGQKKEAKSTRQKASREYARLLKKYPRALRYHASEHYLNTQPKRALELALLDSQERPGGAAFTQLAKAHLALEQKAKASEALARAKASGYLTPEVVSLSAELSAN